MTNLETARKSWISIDKIFGGDGVKFELADFTVEAYEDIRTKYGWDKVKQALKAAFEENDKRMPTVKELKAALSGHSKNDRERATRDAMGIWQAIEGAGANGEIDAEIGLNRFQWRAVQLNGGWRHICDTLTNDDKSNFIAQTRDMLVDLYADIPLQKEDQARLEARKKRLLLMNGDNE